MISKTKKIYLLILPFFVFIIALVLLIVFNKPIKDSSEAYSSKALNDKTSSEEGVKIVVEANNNFAFDFYSELVKSESSNIFYSPYSLSAALAMTYEGAAGKTAEEIKSVFYFPETDILAPNFAAIHNKINKVGKDYELKTGNALWLQHDYILLDEYTNRIKNFYNSQVENLDFVKEAEKSRQIINSYIEEQTNDRIKDLIPEGSLDAMTKLILTNAIYFKGNWFMEFDKSRTSEQNFKVDSQKIVKVPMMSMKMGDKEKFNYADLEKLQILELPYKGKEVSMFVLLPKQGETFDYLTGEESSFNYSLEDIDFSLNSFKEYKEKMKETKMDSISLPKFEFETKYFMKDTLTEMGMSSAFFEADFSKMNNSKDIVIDQVIHQAFIKVDEEGTEAAAVTAVMMELTSMRPQNIFKADHPFIFIIQDNETENILFLGRVVNPLEE